MDWHPTQFFRTSPAPSPFALLVLNQPINENAFGVLHKHATFTICADGGANRFFALMRGRGAETSSLPNAIVGDLDSISPPVRAHYQSLGVPVVEDTDQYSTDFTKCLRYLRGHAGEIVSGRFGSGTGSSGTAGNEGREGDGGNRLEILILGGLGGRVDQAFSQIHHLYSMAQAESSAGGSLYLISEESITFILRRGKNAIHVPGTRYQSQGQAETEGREYLQENVGIIPVTGLARITTSGLEWDVEDWPTSIGGQLSTSNHIRAEKVSVESEESVLFTIELAEGLKGGRRR